ncbi:MAG: diaminopimelate epimerase [Burkholderiaceae bacterium]|jgi:diaminopimelate epimerase|nr:diaminopimelate epimerase [Burkholderiaceae bacterium]
MKIRFTKMHGAGNDFVVINAIDQKVRLTPDQCHFLADRRFGVGADQILLVEETHIPDVDFRYRIFNADGSEVEQCGNGARAFVKFVTGEGLTDKRQIRVETLAGVITLHLEEDGQVTVNMGSPIFDPARIPFDARHLPFEMEGTMRMWQIDLGAGILSRIAVLSMGNPHAIQDVARLDYAPVNEEGPLIERHAHFPRRVNAGFMEIVNSHTIRLRVYERGAGETLACGTGACAAVVSGICRQRLASPVTVHMRGGVLRVAWGGGSHPVLLTGPAVSVFHGEIVL